MSAFSNDTWKGDEDPDIRRNTYTVYECFDEFKGNQCSRSIILTVMMFITCILCICQLTNLLRSRKGALSFQLVVLCLACLETLISALHFVYFGNPALNFVCYYLKLCQYMIVCYFFSTVACKLTDKDFLINYLVRPTYPLIFLGLTGLFVMTLLNRGSFECRDPAWLCYSIFQFGLGGLLTTIGVTILRTLHTKNGINFRTHGREKLLLYLMIAYTFTALVGLIYEVFIYASFGTKESCEDFFSDMTPTHAFLFSVIRIVDILIPVWALLFLFYNKNKARKHKSSSGINWNIQKYGFDTSTYPSMWAPNRAVNSSERQFLLA